MGVWRAGSVVKSTGWRSTDRYVNAGRTTTAAQRNLPGTLRTQEPRGGMEQEPSGLRLYTQMVLGGSEPPRSVDRPVSTGRTTTAAQRNIPGTLRTQEQITKSMCHGACGKSAHLPWVLTLP